jgi:hypothetical protein
MFPNGITFEGKRVKKSYMLKSHSPIPPQLPPNDNPPTIFPKV